MARDYTAYFTDEELNDLRDEYKGLEKYTTFNNYCKFVYEELNTPRPDWFPYWE